MLLACRYGQLWARSGDHEVLMIRPSVMQVSYRVILESSVAHGINVWGHCIA